ncbi:FMN-binding negative transcriptional regulator [Qipengyuania vesicularis]|uniref:FMN-binding negative transcriptional regulator n=1 Tax=Qipengyuania vesicularis TaxID=2867232 RepID=UPI001C87B6E0|nr:FMN-binding negative transcriptional regulator [Qipengyuania vesicularis]MBX7527533.1 FMN-binding negative transcriptional regulator [Qipengyuania vesicularis]
MHPNPNFREQDRSFHRGLIEQVGFGMVFCSTPDGPRVAHSPVILSGEFTLRFHLARGNALTKHLPSSRALIVVNGADAYISARWYSDPDQVSTWNYLAAEMEGQVSAMDREGLVSLLQALTARHEARLQHGTPWSMDKLSETHRERLLKAIVGFEMQVDDWRETVKLSQNKSAEVIGEVVAGLEAEGEKEMAGLMRGYLT